MKGTVILNNIYLYVLLNIVHPLGRPEATSKTFSNLEYSLMIKINKNYCVVSSMKTLKCLSDVIFQINEQRQMSSISFQIGDAERVFHIKSMWLKRVELVHPFKFFSVDVGWRDYL